MSRLVRLTSSALIICAIASSGTALAQDPEPEPDTADKTTDTNKDDDKSSDDESDTEQGGAAAGATSLGSYPQERIKRPRVLPHMTLEPYAELDFLHFDTMGGSDTFTVLGFGAAFGFLQGKAEAGLRTGLQLSPDTDLRDAFELFGAYSLHEGATWAVAGELELNFDVGGGDAFGGFDLGARGIYRLSDTMALLGGRDLISYNAGPDHLDINLNVGFLYQFTPAWSGEVHTTILSLGLIGDGNDTNVIFADFTPLTFAAYYAHDNKLDVYAMLGFDLNDVGDRQQIIVGVRYRFGL